ncbi:MAG: RNA 2',3'-cyclic phosphodiesterase [Candidatus Eremiobacteraeota bacterium]|nr:RNA 2',3'-cyclic phosphodiesterase [Candidatus Eremiobacteraeota bacterium]MBV8497964.1 RNA 2',3'-cyclic phosphodiesterase [Candidatus Eremiobacteraeota bacterium]
MNERKRRLFVGIDLDETAREACAAISERLVRTGFAAHYEARDKLHLTLAFLGYVGAEQYAGVVEALDAAARIAPFAVTLDKVGGFPHERRPRIAYVGAREQGAPFRALSQTVRSAYAARGFEFKNDSVAHVTIARVKAPTHPLPLIEVPAIPLRVERLTLFESLPDRANNTSRYERVGDVRLSVSAV